MISDNAEAILLQAIGNHWDLKETFIGPPKIYLGGQMRKITLDNGSKAWAFGSTQCVKAAAKNVKGYLSKTDEALPARSKAKGPLANGYHPEIDMSDEHGLEDAPYY